MWPHGFQPPSFFLTMCKGEARGEVERRVIPALSENSALATASLVGFRRWDLAKIGCPGFVKMWWSVEDLVAW